MNWEQRVKRYLDSYGYILLGFEGGLVFFIGVNNKVWGSSENALNRNMIEWE